MSTRFRGRMVRLEIDPMTEAEWLASDNPSAMLAYLTLAPRGSRSPSPPGPHGRSQVEARHAVATGRKLRLFACACLDHSNRELLAARNERGMDIYRYGADGETIDEGDAADVARDWATGQRSYDPPPVTKAQLLRCIIGNPFRPVTLPDGKPCYSPVWGAGVAYPILAWNDSAVPRLARSIYARRAWEEMPVLRDALTDAGCQDEAILAHLRGPGPHARGCWVLDLLLGKG